jgi:hypothetical protein
MGTMLAGWQLNESSLQTGPLPPTGEGKKEQQPAKPDDDRFPKAVTLPRSTRHTS